MLSFAAGAALGMFLGLFADFWLQRRQYRYEDERSFPLRSTCWVAPVMSLAAGLHASAWQSSLPVAVLAIGYTAVLIVLNAIDLDVQRLPDKITLPLIPVTAAAVVSVCVLSGEAGDAGRALLAGLALGGFYLAQVVLAGGRGMGLGDAKLAVSLGMVAGMVSWPHVLVATMAAYLSAALVAIVLVVLGKANRKTSIAFGPFMSLGLAATLSVPAVPSMIGLA